MGTDSNAITIHELLQETSIYQMPLFQREYQWQVISELQKFWSDIISVVDGEVDISFLGAVVLQIEKSGSAKSSRIYTVIDGQQRITTFYILLCSICDYASKNNLSDVAHDLEKQYLISGLSAESGKAKLIPTIRDHANFNEVIKNISGSKINLLPDTGSNDGPMILAFMYFSEMVEKFVEDSKGQSKKDRLDNLTTSILEKMEVVQIILDKSHNANEVFDRLNTAGRPLSIVDLVRNELFQTVSEDYDKAHKLYNDLWWPFEKSFERSLDDLDAISRSAVLDGFFFPYALSHFSDAKKNNLLRDLRKIWADECSLVDSSGKKLLDAAKVVESLENLRGPYLALDQGIRMEGVSDTLWSAISNLRRVPIPGVTHPYLMKLLSAVRNQEVDEADALAVCEVLEAFFVRRGFVGLEPTGLHSIFKKLWSSSASDAKLVAKNLETRTISFPNDEEVKRAINEKGLYKRRIEKFVLWAYETHLQKAAYAQLGYLPDITTDHVMPQSWQGDWKNIISEQEHAAAVDLWGNLVPLSKKENSAKGARSYTEARMLLKNETAFATTKQFLEKHDQWTREAIIERTMELGLWAVSRWKKPVTAAQIDTLEFG